MKTMGPDAGKHPRARGAARGSPPRRQLVHSAQPPEDGQGEGQAAAAHHQQAQPEAAHPVERIAADWGGVGGGVEAEWAGKERVWCGGGGLALEAVERVAAYRPDTCVQGQRGAPYCLTAMYSGLKLSYDSAASSRLQQQQADMDAGKCVSIHCGQAHACCRLASWAAKDRMSARGLTLCCCRCLIEGTHVQCTGQMHL